MISRLTQGNRRAFLGYGCRGAGAITMFSMLGRVGLAQARMPELTDLDAVIDRLVSGRLAPGAVAAYGDGAHAPRFLQSGTLAFDSTQLAGPDTLWRIYSQTKLIAGMSAMVLIDQKKLGLDTAVADLLPEFRRMRVLTDPASLSSKPARRAMTVRHLITHTNGLAYGASTKGPLLAELRRLGLNSSAARPGARDGASGARRLPMVTSLKEYAERLATLPLVAEPGSRWDYSAGTDIIGRVVEVVSGKPFDTFLSDTFFRPLGMSSTYFQVPISERTRFATNYAMSGDARIPVDPGATSSYLSAPPFISGGGGLVSTARDYDRFLTLLANRGTLGGITIMSPETAMLGMSNLLPPEVDPASLVALVDGQGFGAGGRVDLTGPGKGTYGWGGAAGSDARVNPFTARRAAAYINVLGQYVFGPTLIKLVGSAAAG